MRCYGKQLLVFLIVLLVSGVSAFGQQKPVRKITNIAGDLYRFQNRFHFSVFLVTPAGIIATDPINADAAQWLKAELKKRFNQPVKYLIYSHDHPDHSSGGQIFADTAVAAAQYRGVVPEHSTPPSGKLKKRTLWQGRDIQNFLCRSKR